MTTDRILHGVTIALLGFALLRLGQVETAAQISATNAGSAIEQARRATAAAEDAADEAREAKRAAEGAESAAGDARDTCDR